MADSKPKFEFVGVVKGIEPVDSVDNLFRLEVLGMGPNQGEERTISFNSTKYRSKEAHPAWGLITASVGTDKLIEFAGVITEKDGDWGPITYYNGRNAREWQQGAQAANGQSTGAADAAWGSQTSHAPAATPGAQSPVTPQPTPQQQPVVQQPVVQQPLPAVGFGMTYDEKAWRAIEILVPQLDWGQIPGHGDPAQADWVREKAHNLITLAEVIADDIEQEERQAANA